MPQAPAPVHPAAGGDGAASPAPVPAYPFPVGVYAPVIQDYDVSVAQTAAAQQLPLWNISPTGWMRGAWIMADMAVTGQSVNNVSYAGDNPVSVVKTVTLYDLGGEVIQTFSGYDWGNVNKYGGYFDTGDWRADPQYSAVTGTGGTAGSFHWCLFLPLEFVPRDGKGTVQNESKPGWKLEINIDSQANTYNQVPSVMGTLRVRGYIEAYTEPAAAESAPGAARPFAETPPLPGTLQYWKNENKTIPAGAFTYDLTNGVGFPIRNIFYKWIDASTPTRAQGDVDIPDPFQLLLGNITLFNIAKSLYLSKIAKDYDFIGAASVSTSTDTALQRENGIMPFYFTKDMTGHPGFELGFKYLDTKVNSLVRLQGSGAAAATLNALVNWIATPSKNRYALIAGG